MATVVVFYAFVVVASGGVVVGVGEGRTRRGREGDMVVQGQRRMAETYIIVTRGNYGDTWSDGVLNVTDVGSCEVVATST